MIMQEKKKNWFIKKLCFKVFFSFEVLFTSGEYFPISYKGILSLNNAMYPKDDFGEEKKEELLFTPSILSLFEQYDLKHLTGDFFYIYDFWYYFFINEHRKLRYTGNMLALKISSLAEYTFSKIYTHYRFFFYSFFFKFAFFKNFHLYKKYRLVEFTWKLSYDVYSIIRFDFLRNVFNNQFEFFPVNLFNVSDFFFEYPIEFFFLKKSYF